MSDTLLSIKGAPAESLAAVAPAPDVLGELDTPAAEVYLHPEDALAGTFTPFYDNLVARGIVIDSPEERRAAFERERCFFAAVYDGVMAAAYQTDGPVTALFDVDNTIIEVDDFEAAPKKTTAKTDGPAAAPRNNGDAVTEAKQARPAFELAVRMLRDELGDRFDIGLLTTHTQPALADELAHPTYLQAVRDVVNSGMVISSKDVSLHDPELRELAEAHKRSDTGRLLYSVQDIVDPRLVSDAGLADLPTDSWYDIKLPILKRVSDWLPGRSLVYVDDLPSAAVIDSANPRLHGVWVGPQVHDYIRRTALEDFGGVEQRPAV